MFNLTGKNINIKKKIIYCDSTASGQIFDEIENIMINDVYPYYANTHSNAYCGKQMTKYIDDTINFMRNKFNIPSDYSIYFVGSGSTSAINLLIHLLGFSSKPSKKYCENKCEHNPSNLLVINSILEHHSNYLPWIHITPEPDHFILDINNKTGKFCTKHLNDILIKYNNKKILCSLNAGSNVIGVVQNIREITEIIKKKNGLIFWDYSACAPYIPINIGNMDGLFMSGHKFRGVAPVGILIIRDSICVNKIPYNPGGGTVRYVSPREHLFTNDLTPGGTPDILGIIKFGLCLKFKDENKIIVRDKIIIKYVLDELTPIKNIEILNPIENIDLPIFALRFKKNANEFYHYNLIVAILNDYYGIQTRGGVNCTFFAEKLLKLTKENIIEIEKSIISGNGVPEYYGWVRMSLNWYDNNYIFVINAIKNMMSNIEKLTSEYIYNSVSNNWNHKKYKIIYKKIL